jgi:transcription-repair coupling factor (superfamily II helicase)
LEIKELLNIAERYGQLDTIIKKIASPGNSKIQLKGLTGSARSLVSAAVIKKSGINNLFIFADKDEAAYFYNDLINLTGSESVLFFPSSYKRSVQYYQPDNGNIILRTRVLNSIGNLQKNEDTDGNITVVSYPEALIEKVITHQKLKKNTLQLVKGEKISIEFIHEVLDEYKFELVDFVYEPGQFAVRGGIVDIFSYSNDYPYRVDFFGDEVETIRSFDVESQLSKDQYNKIVIIPNIQDITIKDVREPFWEYLPNACVWISDARYITDQMNQLVENASVKNENDTEISVDTGTLLTSGHQLIEKLNASRVLEIGRQHLFQPEIVVEFHTAPQPDFNKNFNLLGENLKDHVQQGYRIFILSDNRKQIDRLASIFHDTDQDITFEAVNNTLHEGFIDHDLNICLYTDHQIFERYHKYKLSSYFSSKAALSINEIKNLQPGDYVVHVDHGIGKFGGLNKIEVNGKMQEAIRLVYRDNDILYVSIHALHRISKYKGKDDIPPRIYKLGTGAWQKLKQNTKKKIKDIARDLIALYAKRKAQKGFEFSADTYLQNELEASFVFEDTPDQEKATVAVKSDMESDTPMDRLICGDVGFGKTEVAVRAAFKAVTDSKQVALLVPTTILALQHYNTFKERLKDFPCTVDYISRLKKPKYQKEALKKLEEGKLDIIIGTHRLVGNDVKFKDLGLLIIDEEQKFGVTVKEKLKKLKLNVDNLTLTATPIPRTLQFSLMGARDLSVINTPPPNRHPIITELYTFNEDIIREGIYYEVSRNGQVFFIHNRVQNINEVESLINRLCPEVKTIVAHGQMEGPKLEQVVLDFINGDYDVLVATTIIESGMDIPNANTIFINDAQNFGLSDLHQLRGRVGRSNRKAFCYLLAPPLAHVTPEARRRLKAIEEFSDLGSGFNIALQDLDIRGAGNLLGSEQSGFIADIGFETYNRILEEAMQELKENEFKDLYTKEKEAQPPVTDQKFLRDCQIDTDLELLFPDFYISNISERIRLYRELDNIETEEKLKEFETHLVDRFGPLPEPSQELLKVVRLRRLSMTLGFEKLVLKNKKLLIYFISDQTSAYYQSPVFSKILAFVQKQPKRFQMKEGNNKLTLTISHIDSLQQVEELLEMLSNENEEMQN